MSLFVGSVNEIEGFTVKSATWVDRRSVGARYERMMRMSEVRDKRGAR